MRDPARIDIVLDTIRAYWKRRPDLRLCQIIGNVTGSDSVTYNTEDDVLLNQLGANVEEHAIDCNWVLRREWCQCPRRIP